MLTSYCYDGYICGNVLGTRDNAVNNFFLAMPHNKEFTIIGTGICISERGRHGHEGTGIYVLDSGN